AQMATSTTLVELAGLASLPGAVAFWRTAIRLRHAYRRARNVGSAGATGYLRLRSRWLVEPRSSPLLDYRGKSERLGAGNRLSYPAAERRQPGAICAACYLIRRNDVTNFNSRRGLCWDRRSLPLATSLWLEMDRSRSAHLARNLVRLGYRDG